MDSNPLVETAQQGGRQLIARLRESGFPVSTAFWWHDAETDDWRLYVATPEVNSGLMRPAYLKVDAVIESLDPKPPFTLNDVYLIESDDRVAQAMSAVRAEPGSIKRLSKTNVGRLFVDSAYLYTL